MSETDDTDVLLLIPPNFFLVNSSGSEDSLLQSSRTVVHKPTSCTAQVLGKLVDQVHSLESRLSSLEINSSIDTVSTLGTHIKRCDTSDSIDSRSLDSKYFTFPRRRRRKHMKRGKNQDLSLTGLEVPTSASATSIPILKLNDKYKDKELHTNDSRSMDGDISSIVSTPSKKNDKLLLNEIDEFLTKVEAYESPDLKYNNPTSGLSPQNVIKVTGDYISQKIDPNNTADDIAIPSGCVVPSTILNKYIYLVKSQPETQEDNSLRHSSLQKSQNEEYSREKELQPAKLETRSPITRRLNFSDSKDVQPTSTPKRQLHPSGTHDTFRPSSNKIYDRATKVLEQYKAQNYSRNQQNTTTDASYLTASKKEEFKMPQMRPYSYDNNKESIKVAGMQNRLVDTIDTDLLSLSDLWGERGDKLDRGDSLKLEEERLKREHCEAMIQQLQKKILDQQEKLAVALKVDRTKDAAIAKLKDAWLKITGSLDRAEERHRTALEKMVKEIENFKTVADEAQKKTNHFEAELYKALDLAHDYQEKCKQLLAEKKQIESGMEKALTNQREIISSKDKEVEMLRENYDTVMKLNKQSTDCVRNIEEALSKEKSEHEITRSKVNELTQKIQNINDEISLILQERDMLKEKVKEERSRGNILERQLCEKQNQTSELFKKCDTLDSEVKALRKHMEIQKTELKVHYQKQLEDAVLAKLQEFQQQLDLAEKEMESDAKSKESAIVDNFNKQILRLEEQHKLEINVLEEKQKEEINLYRLQLAQASEKIGLLDNKLETYKRRRGQIASQLHSVMEAQWRQALLILTSGHAGSALDLTRTDTVSSPPVAQDYAPPKIPPSSMPMFDKSRRPPDNLFNLEGLSDTELQQYVKLLLTKPPNWEGSGDCARDTREDPEEPTSDRPDRNDRRDKTCKRPINSHKPPWKA